MLAVEAAIDALVSHGIVARDGSECIFRPRTADLEAKIERLAACYRDRRTTIITLIYLGDSRVKLRDP